MKDGLRDVPVVSILINQMIDTIKQKSITYSVSLSKDVHIIYKGICKHGPQTFLAPDAEGYSTMPARKARNTIYVRCLRIYKSAMSEATVNKLESGMHLDRYLRKLQVIVTVCT